MNKNELETLNSLNALIGQILSGEKTKFDNLTIEASDNTSINELRDNIFTLAKQYNENYAFIKSLSNGNLDVFPPLKNSFSNPFKQLHSTLLHLTWQIKQISEGDFDQVVSYSGDFSEAFNKMTSNLKEKQKVEELNLLILKELKELNAMKDRFFTTISHDLKSPFTSLIGMSDYLIDELRMNNFDNALQYAEALKSAAQQGYVLLSNLLEWAKSQMKNSSVEIVPVSVNDAVYSATKEVTHYAKTKDIELLYLDNNIELHVLADLNMLKTVLRNLLNNAVKFSFSGSIVRISALKERENVIIAISDNGVGIDEKSVNKLFNLDSNFSTKGTENEPGTGLGLIICKEYIDKMSGTIGVKSELNKGTEFIISLPYV